MPTSRAIVLNGPSSAGKSTLAKAVRERAGATMAVVSLDQLFACMHPEARNDWHLFATLTDALFATAAALVDGGFDVVVDTVFERADCLVVMQRRLGDRPHRLVAVTCPLEVLEERERVRGNRRLGQARDQCERVLHGAAYDAVVDTHAAPLAECVDRVIAVLDGIAPGAR